MIEFKPKAAEQSFIYRAFLNDEYSIYTGSMKLAFDVRRKGTKAKGYHWTLNGNMEIRDCARRIDLSFNGNTKGDIDDLMNSKEKLQRLKEACETGLAVIAAMENQQK